MMSRFKNSFAFKLLNAILINSLLLNFFIESAYAFQFKNYNSTQSTIFSALNDANQKLATKDLPEAVEHNSSEAKIHLTSSAAALGAGQTESKSFSINSNDNILNKFTGDLNYSIPLMDVDGFPINISYNPNISMDQEASWVGLGWDLSLGSINREMRGVPDEFDGDVIERVYKVKDETVKGKIKDGQQKPDAVKNGVGIAAGSGRFIGQTFSKAPDQSTIGSINLSVDFQLLFGKYLNSYTGVGHTKDIGTSISFGAKAFGEGFNGNLNLGYSIDDQNGIGRTAGYTFGYNTSLFYNTFGQQYGKSWSVNSRTGIKSITETNTSQRGMESNFFGVESSNSYSSTISFGARTYVPKFNFNSNSRGNDETFTFGVTGVYLLNFLNLRYINEQYNITTQFNVQNNNLRAYGYFNFSNSENDKFALLDFNRDGRDHPSSQSQHLNFSQPTFDLFYCNAPGISSTFRGMRYEIYKLSDPDVTNHSFTTTHGGSLTVVGGQSLIGPQLGFDQGSDNGTITSDNNSGEAIESNFFPFLDDAASYNKKEYYLSSIGENTYKSDALFSQYKDYTPTRLGISMTNENDIELSGQLEFEGGVQALPTQNADLNRQNTAVYYKEYSGQDLVDQNIEIKNYPLLTASSTNFYQNTPSVLPHITSNKKAHHIQAVEVVNSSGERYFFGVPNYNYFEKSVTFSVKQDFNDVQNEFTGLIQYDNTDPTIDNSKGRQEMFDCQVTPSYAHSFLLTEIYTNDYVDLTQNGPSKDDIGNYHKINYTNVYGESSSNNKFSWRFPLSTGTQTSGGYEKQHNLAYYQENLETDPWDDVANYSYGEKDIWYGQSIESKDMVAFFILEERKDMVSVNEISGQIISTKKGYLLKRIELYSKSDLEINHSNAKPLQVVEFEYDYSLCQNYPGNIDFVNNVSQNNDGKLTLKAIYSYSGKSNQIKTSPYQFEYASGTENPTFAYNSSDRWGNYKPNNISYPNHQFPFSDQNESQANANIQAWKLKIVKVPGGSEMEFEYEADSYSYVQNKRAMRMFSVIGMSGYTELQSLNLLSGNNISHQTILDNTFNHLRVLDEKKNPYEIIYFQLSEPITKPNLSDAVADLKKQYFSDENGNEVSKILVNLYADLGDLGEGANERYEYVQSIVSIEHTNGLSVGLVGSSGSWNFGYMVIETQAINENSDNYLVSSLQLANWQYARMNTPYLIYGEPNYVTNDPLLFCDYSTSIDGRIVFGLDVNKKINKEKYGLYFKREKSQIRLFEPDNKKFGGNAKIVAITFRNNWNNVSGEQASTYKWIYKYGDSENHGNASYEPQVGSVENPLYQLTGYDLERYFLPDERNYHFTPVCDMIYPSPIVGYESVESSFSPDLISPSRSVGKNVDYFFTSRDFPVKFNYTSSNSLVAINKTEGNAIQDTDQGKVIELLGLTEGFVVETNDMHGKFKQSEVYDSKDNLVSRQKYIYSDPYSKSVGYLNENGDIIPDYPPREIDMYVDSWKNETEMQITQDGRIISLGLYILSPIPIPYFFLSTHDFN